jgi:hypothetical protein
MNPTGKKFVSLFLVFSLMMLSVNLYAKERRGAKLLITKKDGGKIEGELIAVKEDSLLILTKWLERDESIDIADVEVITIVKKSEAGKGPLYGLLIGGGLGGAAAASAIIRSEGDTAPWEGILATALYVAIGGAVGYLIGGIIGISTGTGKKTIQIEGMTSSEIQKTLDKLRKKARVRDYK